MKIIWYVGIALLCLPGILFVTAVLTIFIGAAIQGGIELGCYVLSRIRRDPYDVID